MNIKNYFTKSLLGENPTSSTSANLQENDECSTAEEVLSESDSDNYQIKSPRKQRKYSHQKPGGNNSKFQQQYITKYEKDCIKSSSKSNNHFFCEACGEHKNLGRIAERAIVGHTKSKKHIKNLADHNTNSAFSNFVKTRTFNEQRRALTAELAFVYHCARLNFSIRSADCGSKLIPVLFEGSSSAENFASARNKSAALINGVITPYLSNKIQEEINESGGFYSIGFDSTSRDEQRIYAIVIRYFNHGTRTKLLQLLEMPSEKAVDMTNLMKKTLEEKQLDLNKMVSVCMDNTMSNFGGVLRRGQQNVFYFLKKEIPKLVGIGCPSHIANNSVRRAIEQMDYDVTQIANTITSHFSNHALRWEKYQEFCEEFQHPVRTFTDFAPTRWLSLGKLVRIINHFI